MTDPTPRPPVDVEATYEVLLFTSYCGDNSGGCTYARPCDECLSMSNVFRVSHDAIIVGSEGNYVRELGGYSQAASLKARNAELDAENARLREMLTDARRHVWATNQAQHLMDGFGPVSSQPSDALLEQIDAALSSDATIRALIAQNQSGGA